MQPLVRYELALGSPSKGVRVALGTDRIVMERSTGRGTVAAGGAVVADTAVAVVLASFPGEHTLREL